jgi:hypothetical protein
MNTGSTNQSHPKTTHKLNSMHARINDMAIPRATMRKEHTLKLRVVQHKYAAQVAAHARALERHARKLQRLHAKINADSTAIAGADRLR